MWCRRWRWVAVVFSQVTPAGGLPESLLTVQTDTWQGSSPPLPGCPGPSTAQSIQLSAPQPSPPEQGFDQLLICVQVNVGVDMSTADAASHRADATAWQVAQGVAEGASGGDVADRCDVPPPGLPMNVCH